MIYHPKKRQITRINLSKQKNSNLSAPCETITYHIKSDHVSSVSQQAPARAPDQLPTLGKRSHLRQHATLNGKFVLPGITNLRTVCTNRKQCPANKERELGYNINQLENRQNGILIAKASSVWPYQSIRLENNTSKYFLPQVLRVRAFFKWCGLWIVKLATMKKYLKESRVRF